MARSAQGIRNTSYGEWLVQLEEYKRQENGVISWVSSAESPMYDCEVASQLCGLGLVNMVDQAQIAGYGKGHYFS